jgi:hypothetical protein
MIRRMTIVLGMAALLVAISATDTLAARYRISRHRGHYTYRHSATHHVSAKSHSYHRTHQTGGKSLWNLGKQNGEWPR